MTQRHRDKQSDLGPVIGAIMPHRPTIHLRKELDPVAAIVTAVCAVSGVILMCVVLFAVFMFAMIWTSKAKAHGPAQWIQDGKHKNAAGELCCGERDCFELADVNVRVTARGYYVVSLKETVPYSEATPSPDGKYWRCAWGGKRKCFFAPPGSS